MKFNQLGDFIYIPKLSGTPLKEKKNVKFNYYLSSRINGKYLDLDVTTKLFEGNDTYIRKACYRVRHGEIENCVKATLIDHMKSLGMEEKDIPKSLFKFDMTNKAVRSSGKRAFSH